MKKLRAFISVCAAGLLSSEHAWAGSLYDYSGTLGTQKIGMMIEDANIWPSPKNKFGDVHYYYVRHLKNIPLKVVEHEGRRFILEEADKAGNPTARFHVEFPEYDRFNHYSHTGPDPVKLEQDQIVGTWETLDGKQSIPVVLFLDHMITGGEGGRCELTAEQYQRVENRAKEFYEVAIKGDAARLRRDFHYSMPTGPGFRGYLAKSVPHDMFCHKGAFLLGWGWVSFDKDGNAL